jgi:trehalose 6-phosphate phosphatase
MNDLRTAIEAAADVLAFAPAALVTDVDGTLSRIVSRPENATVEDDVRISLQSLVSRVALVAIVTGREESVARSMVGLPELTYVGNYALDDEAAEVVEEDDLDSARMLVRTLLAPFPCVEIEEKGVSFALHYRNCIDVTMRERILTLVSPVAAAAGAKLLEGKQVVELVPIRLPDKSNAVARLLRERDIQGVVYLGDDLGDVPVFQQMSRRRAQGLPSLALAVVDSETHAAVLESADMLLRGVDEVQQLLAALGTPAHLRSSVL